MKRLYTVLLMLIAVLMLSACSASQPTPRPAPAEPPVTTEYTPPPPPEVDPLDDLYSTFAPVPEKYAMYADSHPSDAAPTDVVTAAIETHCSTNTPLARMTHLFYDSDYVLVDCSGQMLELHFKWKHGEWYLSSTCNCANMFIYAWHEPSKRGNVVPM